MGGALDGMDGMDGMDPAGSVGRLSVEGHCHATQHLMKQLVNPALPHFKKIGKSIPPVGGIVGWMVDP